MFESRLGASGRLRPRRAGASGWDDWRWQMRRRLVSPADFASVHRRLGEAMAACSDVLETYPAAATPYYLTLADPEDPRDPILAQCLPAKEEAGGDAALEEDPLDETGQSPVPGVVHRYPDRALLLVTNACFVRCRHCNRKRHWRLPERAASRTALERMVAYVRSRRELREVVISGGDPLTMSTPRLGELLSALRAVPHLEAVRIGTRAPAALPFRVDRELCSLLEKHAPVWINTHFNHPREATPEAAEACLRLLRAGCPVNNQTVLLAGVNDDARTLADLFHALQRMGVRPYYLFQADPVRGTGHFRTPVSRGLEILAALGGHTSGLCVPAFALDTPGGRGKVTIAPDRVAGRDGRWLLVRDYLGNVCRYPDAAPEGEKG